MSVFDASAQMTTPENSEREIDWVEVGRASHELGERHGRNAHVYALGLANKAKTAGDLDAARFWHAVHAALRPR